MKAYFLAPAIGVLVFFSMASARANNSCVTCHSQSKAARNSAHDYAEWKLSRHAQNNITCEICHGGNAGELDKTKAHAGIIPAGNPKSPLYFSNIPEMCGRCHTGELKQFRKSYHFGELKRTGRGPNCATCHGAMAARILEPRELEETCSVCHKERPMASEALVTLNLAVSAVEKLENAVGPGSTNDLLKSVRKRLTDLKKMWHSFDLDAVAVEANKIVTTAHEEEARLRLTKGGQKQ